VSYSFHELAGMAAGGDERFRSVTRDTYVAATRERARLDRDEIRARHDAGELGSTIVQLLSARADRLLRGVFSFALFPLANPRQALSRVSLCALGGYGRGELSPHSDLDVCLLYDGRLDATIEQLNDFLVPFLWDIGFAVGYAIRSVPEAMELARTDIQALTSFIEGRVIAGDNTAFARVKLAVREWASGDRSHAFVQLRLRERRDGLPEQYRDLYRPEPDIKEGAGGLRDIHTALWLLMMVCGTSSLDDIVSQGLVSPEEHLEVVQALDFIWRIRNELHFHTRRAENRLTFENQEHVARAFGYHSPGHTGVTRLMEDYYDAARHLRRFLHLAVGICDSAASWGPAEAGGAPISDYSIRDGELYVGMTDRKWFIENPVRLIEAFWECARYGVRLSPPTERMVTANLGLIGDSFRSSDLVRRFFVAICGRPSHAAQALRQMASTGFLAAYIPEFAAVQGVIRYEDFHSYPVDEHILRALEAIPALEPGEGVVTQCLRMALDELPDPHILTMAILFHDLGKAAGEVHVEAGVHSVHEFCQRTRMPVDDEERVAFLVQHHMLMTKISQFRDTDDEDIVRAFAHTIRTGDRLRALFVLSYCDLAAVGPEVWNDWKGALLLRLYLKTQKLLQGGDEEVTDALWESPKAVQIGKLLAPAIGADLDGHLRGLGDRYFAAFSADEIADHLGCVAEAREHGLAVRFSSDEATNRTAVVISTGDRPGLFAEIAGCFASQLVDVNGAALFTRPDGLVVDCFVVTDVSGRRPLTGRECAGIERVLRAVLIQGEDVAKHVEQSRRRLFALEQPRIPVRTRVEFDNESSRTHTVIDIHTGDRTGLLYDIARAMTGAGLDITTARIVTDARHVRDSFYVTCDGQKLETEEVQAWVRERIRGAIHPRALAEHGGNKP